MSDFQYMMENLRVPPTDKEIHDMVKDADRLHTGYVTYDGKHDHTVVGYSGTMDLLFISYKFVESFLAKYFLLFLISS